MTVVDTSVLAAVVFAEPDAETLMRTMMDESDLVMSAATLVEAIMVVEGRAGPQGGVLLRDVITTTGINIVPFDQAQAAAAGSAWRRFGKGSHPAALNLGDCFSYALAKTTGEPLHFKGNDFAQTDISTP